MRLRDRSRWSLVAVAALVATVLGCDFDTSVSIPPFGTLVVVTETTGSVACTVT